MQNSREEFEEAYVEISGAACYSRKDNGEYEFEMEQEAWEVWQAARAQECGEAVAVGPGERLGATIYLGLQQSVAVEWADEQVLNEIEQTDLDEVFGRVTEGKPCGRYSVVFREETEYPDSDCIGSPCLVPVASRAVVVNTHPSASVPERLLYVEDGGTKKDDYVNGWNECIDAMLTGLKRPNPPAEGA